MGLNPFYVHVGGAMCAIQSIPTFECPHGGVKDLSKFDGNGAFINGDKLLSTHH